MAEAIQNTSEPSGLDAIPDKLYFKIGEVSQLAGVAPYVLRYWETEFGEISPVKSPTNQRLYKRRDVELILRIKHLLYKERFTINGAKKKLKEEFKIAKIRDDENITQLDFALDPDAELEKNPTLKFKIELIHDLKTVAEDIDSYLAEEN